MSSLDKKSLEKFLQEIKKTRIGIVGDSMLDIFSYGEIKRISPEAPVPVIEVTSKEFIPGGAANVARNITSLGGKVTLFSIRGDDESGITLEKMLIEDGVTIDSLVVSNKQTTVKERIIENGKHFVRLDTESKDFITQETETKLINNFKKVIETIDILVFSDYAKGVITENLVSEFCRLAHTKSIPIIVDTKPKNAVFFCGKNVSLFTPNIKEAVEISGKKNILEASQHLEEYFSSKILITKGEEGMTLYNKEEVLHVNAISSRVVDVSGCGDTVVAVLALALAVKEPLYEAISFANHAAGIVVQKKGTATVSRDEFLDYYGR